VPGGLAGWIIWPKPEPLASLEDTVEAIERIAADGSVVTPWMTTTSAPGCGSCARRVSRH
jgi:hypothetical protein